MPDDLMPEDLRDFILGHINSIVQLEALPPRLRSAFTRASGRSQTSWPGFARTDF